MDVPWHKLKSNARFAVSAPLALLQNIQRAFRHD
ncbi:hypothetical protein SAMN05216593_102190 [Pseudomonas asturiensis]|uniref:Uncharacterized protein n=1 Tax=Pseudomonas asturiensis TaxID=1190415 RepID=A0A1M7KJK8_9PSED|nr:hypothetical protein SAMN05216593_102190 [Pseudomonas asturiensis]